MRRFQGSGRRFAVIAVAVLATAPVVLIAPAADAFPKGDSVIGFAYKIKATTIIKKLNQTITPPPGTFKGEIDIDKQRLQGSIKLPKVSFTLKLANVVPLVTATAQIVQAKPVTGTINLTTLKTTATSVFNLRILSATATGLPVNLVGNSCTTATPIKVTMSGKANLAGASKFAGTFTIPQFKTCGLATAALNQLIPGPGNTFSAVATP